MELNAIVMPHWLLGFRSGGAGQAPRSEAQLYFTYPDWQAPMIDAQSF
jgi:hypothetical protein